MEFRNFTKQIAYDMLSVDEFFREGGVGQTVAFIQRWGSTALGFKGMGGSAMTYGTTIVVMDNKHVWNVFFGGNFAYKVGKTEDGDYPKKFMEAMDKHQLPSQYDAEKFGAKLHWWDKFDDEK